MEQRTDGVGRRDPKNRTAQHWVVRAGLAEKVTSEQRSEGDEEVSHAGCCRKSVPLEGTAKGD